MVREMSDGELKPAGFLGVEFRGDFSEAGGDFLEFGGIGEAAVQLGLLVGLLGGEGLDILLKLFKLTLFLVAQLAGGIGTGRLGGSSCVKRCPRGLDVGDRRHFKQISSPERAKKSSVATF